MDEQESMRGVRLGHGAIATWRGHVRSWCGQQVRPGARKTNASRFLLSVSHIIAGLLILTALLKLLYLFGTPITRVRADAVVTFLTNREVLLLGSVVEISVAILLIQSRDLWKCGVAVLYFTACATVYQCALLVRGDVPCQCLGAASDWLGFGTTATISRLLLAAFWVYAFATLRSIPGSSRGRLPPPSKGITVLVLITTIFPWYRMYGATVSIEGTYSATVRREAGERIHQENLTFEFGALFDTTSMIITTVYANAGPRHDSGYCTNTVFIDKATFCRFFRCEEADARYGQQPETTYATLSFPDYPWKLGNCGDSVATWAFVTVRCLDVFPLTTSKGVRLFAPTSSMIGEGLACVTEAHYDFSNTPEGTVLTCDIAVSASLRSNYLASPFIPASFSNADSHRELNSLARLKPGFLCERIRFSRFTNVANIQFPTLVEAEVFTPPVTKRIAGSSVAQTNRASTTETVLLRNIRYPLSVTVSPFPLGSKSFSVTEERLFDRKAAIGGPTYTRTELSSLEVSPEARAAFDQQIREYHQRLRIQRIKRIFTGILVLTVFGGPFLIVRLFRRRYPSFAVPTET